jgi:amicyanin
MTMSKPRSLQRSWRAAAAVAAVGTTLLVAACGNSTSSTAASGAITPADGRPLAGFPGTSASPSLLPTAMPSDMPGIPASAPATSAAPVTANSVSIRNFAFGPQVVAIKAGTTVHWMNQDSEAHTVTSDTGTFNSPVLQPNSGYSFTFNKPGTYTYHCTIHPFMTGKVVVS